MPAEVPAVAGPNVVCVTGAGGFIASWLVKLLLEKGYTVKGTVRNPGEFTYMTTWNNIYAVVSCLVMEYLMMLFSFVGHLDDPKNSHLKELKGAKDRLILCKADLQDYESLCQAINGCEGVFHTASPVTDDPVTNLSNSSFFI